MEQTELVPIKEYNIPARKGKSRNPYAVRPTKGMYTNPELHQDVPLFDGINDSREYCYDYYSKTLIEGMEFKTLKELNAFIGEVWRWAEKKIDRENLRQAKAMVELIEANPALSKLVKEQLIKAQ